MINLLLNAMTIQERQLIIYGFTGVIGLLAVFLLIILALKIKASRDEQKSEILPSLSELGLDTSEVEEEPTEVLEEGEASSLFYEDEENNLNVESFLDRK